MGSFIVTQVNLSVYFISIPNPIFTDPIHVQRGPEQHGQHGDSLHAGWSGVQTLVGERFFLAHPDQLRPNQHPAQLVPSLFPGDEVARVWH